jgi:hypothetical protein
LTGTGGVLEFLQAGSGSGFQVVARNVNQDGADLEHHAQCQ